MGRQTGFTIVELIITVVVAGVVAAIAAPNLAEFLRNGARTSQINDLIGTLNYARSQAVTNRVAVSICPVQVQAVLDGGDVDWDHACTGDADLREGYVVFEDGGDTSGDIDDGEDVLRVVNMDLADNSSFESGTAAVTFLPTGMLDSDARLQFRYCDKRGNAAARYVDVSLGGQARLSDATVDDCP